MIISQKRGLLRASFHSSKGNSAGTNGTETTGTNVHGLMLAVYNDLNSSNVRLPGSIGLSVRVRNIVTKGNALLAYAALCHD